MTNALRILHMFALLAFGALIGCAEDQPSPELEATGPDEDSSTAPPPDGQAPIDHAMVGTSEGGTLEDAGDGSTIDPVPDAGPLDPDAGPLDPDAGPSCDSDCPEDDLRCSDDVVERCAIDSDGCRAWMNEEACALGTPRCVQTETSASCEVALPTCSDEIQNQDETDTDCGGAVCDGCVLDEGCETPNDCALGTCIDDVCAPLAPTCTDLFARPSGFAEPNSLPWPLISKATGQPRAAIGNTFGEYQNFDMYYVHTGIDIRGTIGDYVKIVADGNIWLTANLTECEDNAGSACRLYIRSASGRYIYYYSHLLLGSTDPLATELRARIMNASPRGGGSYAVQPNTEVVQGETLSAIADFPGWNHLHFGIFDAQQNYDGINPLLALDLESADAPIIDDEPPTITAPRAYMNDTSSALSALRCDELSGELDLQSESWDSFYSTDPAPEAFSSQVSNNGLYAAELFIRNVATGEVDQRTWYEMSSMPFDCVGPLRGAQCSVQLSEADFFARSIDQTSGAPHVGDLVTPMLFNTSLSSSAYNGVESHQLILTHSWGDDGAWVTPADPDGVYQLSVEARDHAGNRSAATRFTVIDNSGTFDPTTSTPDAYVRDAASDVGAIPSSLGNAPVWTSPDIFIVPAGTAVTAVSEPPLIALSADTAYDVYVRVNNHGCSPIEDVRVRLTAAQADIGLPHLLLDEQTAITTAGSFVGDATNPEGLDLAADSVGLLGPFAFTPTSQLVGTTRSCTLFAEIDAPSDPRDAARSASLDNNFAARSIGVAADSAAPAFFFGNPTQESACVQLLFERVGLPVTDPASSAVLVVPSDPALSASWAAVPGTTIEVVDETLRIAFLRARVALPPVVLPAGTRLLAQVELQTPASAPDAAVRFSQYTAGVLTSGVELR